MITEDYVSFETAKLLKEKGFNEICEMFYCKSHEGYLKNCERDEWWNSNLRKDMTCTCPTLQMAMKWLREHKLQVSPRYDEVEDEKERLHYVWFFDILSMNPYKILFESEHGYNTYEEACENAIKYCLENLV